MTVIRGTTMDAFLRDDGRPIRIVPGFRKRVRASRAATTPLGEWTGEQFAVAAETKLRRFRRLLAEVAARRDGGLAGAEVLDVGCGAGTNCLLMALQPIRRVAGIDLDLPLAGAGPADPQRRLLDAILELAGCHSGVEGVLRTRPVRLLRMDARNMAFADGAFDLVISRSAMEHLMPIEAGLREMARVVRPGGLVHHGIDPFYWLRGCHKRGVTDIPWAHARLTPGEYRRFVAQHEGPEKADKRARRIETLNRLTAVEWRRTIEAGPFEVLAWHEEPSAYAEEVLREHPDVLDTLLPGVSPSDLTCGRIDVWLRRRPD